MKPIDSKEGQLTTNRYEKQFGEDSFWKKVRRYAFRAGGKAIYTALLLYYVLQKHDLPAKPRATIIGALGYFISPIDAIPDFLPIVGFTDDIAVLLGALAIAALYIDDGVREKAREEFKDIFGKYPDFDE